MGHIRHLRIAAKDEYGGAVELLDKSEFLKSKHIEVIYENPILGYVQRTLQVIRELLYATDEVKKKQILSTIRLSYPQSVETAEELVANGYVERAIKEKCAFAEIFDTIVELYNGKITE